MFSIIIPLFNKEKTCSRSIESVLNQTFSEWELIIVNDGSTDNSFEVAMKAVNGDCRVRFIQQENGGVSVARNNGVKAARNQYIAFLDADDRWHIQYLEIMQKVINAYPGYLWWGSDYISGSEKKLESQYPQDQIYPATIEDVKIMDYFKESLWIDCINMDSFIVLKSAFLEIGGFSEGVKFGEDQDLYCRLAVKSKLPRTQKKLSYYFLFTENNASWLRKDPSPTPLFPFLRKNLYYIEQSVWNKNEPIYWMQEYICNRFLQKEWVLYRLGSCSRKNLLKNSMRLYNKTLSHRLFITKLVLYSLFPKPVLLFLWTTYQKIRQDFC